MKITTNGNYLCLKFPYNPITVQTVRGLPGAKWQPDDKTWRVSNSPYTCAMLLTLFPNADADEKVHKMAILHSVLKRMSTATEPITEPVYNLRPYQMAGVEFIEVCNGRAFIADDTGTGKTPTVLVWARLRGLKRILVVCPSSVQLKWVHEIKRWFDPDSNPVIVQRTLPENADIMIMSYDRLRRSVDYITDEFDLLILDECIAIKNHRSQRGKAARQIAKNCKHILALSATPIPNRKDELFNQLRTIRPWEYTNFFTFQALKEETLKERLVDIMICRRKEDVLKQLPPITEIEAWSDLSEESMEHYSRVEMAIREELKLLNPNHKGYFVNALDKITALRVAVGKAKAQLAIEHILSFVDNNDSGLVVSCFFMTTMSEIQKAIAKIPHEVITGNDNIRSRQDKIDRFRTGKARVLLMSSVGQEGIDLFGLEEYQISNIVLVDKHWTPAAEDQIKGRLHRIGQKYPVTATYLLAKHTIDLHMTAVTERKRKLEEKIVPQKETVRELVRLIIEGYSPDEQ